jgi:hypothetical protein
VARLQSFKEPATWFNRDLVSCKDHCCYQSMPSQGTCNLEPAASAHFRQGWKVKKILTSRKCRNREERSFSIMTRPGITAQNREEKTKTSHNA